MRGIEASVFDRRRLRRRGGHLVVGPDVTAVELFIASGVASGRFRRADRLQRRLAALEPDWYVAPGMENAYYSGLAEWIDHAFPPAYVTVRGASNDRVVRWVLAQDAENFCCDCQQIGREQRRHPDRDIEAQRSRAVAFDRDVRDHVPRDDLDDSVTQPLARHAPPTRGTRSVEAPRACRSGAFKAAA
jgi:hypothetical protein